MLYSYSSTNPKTVLSGSHLAIRRYIFRRVLHIWLKGVFFRKSSSHMAIRSANLGRAIDIWLRSIVRFTYG